MIADGGLISNSSFQVSFLVVSFKPAFAKRIKWVVKNISIMSDTNRICKPNEQKPNKLINRNGHSDTKIKS